MVKTVAAGIFLVRKDGKLLVCHPTNHNPNFWSIPKGKVDDGEHIIDAAIRETYEESNIILSFARNIRPLEPVNYKHGKKILHPFVVFEFENLGLDWGSFDIKCNSNVPEQRGGFPEMDAYKWVTLEEAKTLLHSTQVACLDKIEIMLLENTNL